nr:MAG TPA: hypothetical protein [Caudoviricetes sp.]
MAQSGLARGIHSTKRVDQVTVWLTSSEEQTFNRAVIQLIVFLIAKLDYR